MSFFLEGEAEWLKAVEKVEAKEGEEENDGDGDDNGGGVGHSEPGSFDVEHDHCWDPPPDVANHGCSQESEQEGNLLLDADEANYDEDNGEQVDSDIPGTPPEIF